MADATPGVSLRDVRLASPNPSVCPFLRSEDEGGVAAPIEAPDASNVCAALDESLPQSTRQQELVCLVAAHVDCPRYLRGILLVPPPEPVRAHRIASPAVVASLTVLLVSAIVSVGYVAAAGGLSVPLTAAAGSTAPTPSPTLVAAASATPAPTAAPTSEPTPEPSAASTPAPTPEPSAASTPSPAPTPSPTPAPTPAPTQRPTSDRYAVLTACAGQSNCWIYVVRAGDNLYSIAHWFGVPIDSIYRMNPWTRTTPLRAGQELRIPTPTR